MFLIESKPRVKSRAECLFNGVKKIEKSLGMKDTWRYGNEETELLREVLSSGDASSMSGSFNQIFETNFAKCVGANFGVSFNSGTSTLHAALDALDVGFGDEVLVPALTVIANLQVILAQNAVPIFVDIDPNTYNIDPKDLESKVTKKTKAIFVVPLYGAPCDFDEILIISKKYKIPVINDAAQAPLAEYKGRPIASLFDITSFSFDATKHMTTGDGGMITTLSEGTAEKIRKFGCLGYKALKAKDGRIRVQKDIFQNPNYSRHDDLGLNYRMSEFQAAVGVAQTKKLEFFVGLRQNIAMMYKECVEDSGFLKVQSTPQGSRHAYWTFAVEYKHPEISWQKFRQMFIENGGSGIYAAWKLLYQEDVFKNGMWKKRCPKLYSNYVPDRCPNAEKIQPTLMQFPLNYASTRDAKASVSALRKTIEEVS